MFGPTRGSFGPDLLLRERVSINGMGHCKTTGPHIYLEKTKNFRLFAGISGLASNELYLRGESGVQNIARQPHGKTDCDRGLEEDLKTIFLRDTESLE